MRKPLIFLAICLLAVVLVAVAALGLLVEDHPRIDRQVILTPEHVERAKQIVDAQRYRVRPGMVAAFKVLPEDADLAANYLAHRFAKGSAQVSLADRSADVQLSLPVGGSLMGGYLNVQTTLIETAGLPQPRSLRVGKLSLPDWLTDLLVPPLLRWQRRTPEYRAGLDALQKVQMSAGGLRVVYRWEGGFPHEVRASAISEQERERLLRYQSFLAENSRRGRAASVSLAEVLQPLFRLATERVAEGDPVAENRAAILVVTFYVLGKPLRLLLPEAASWPRPTRRVITLDGRDDFAKHFMVSATIAAYADTKLSDAVGVYKEIEDSRSGSGFSFNDIAADRAGTRFGEKAVAGEDAARKLQQRAASGLQDTDMMPPWLDLPESMPELMFKQRFGGIDAPEYRRMMQEIEQRVAALVVLR